MSRRIESISTILFDWDGTLVDSAQLGLVAYEKSFAALGVPFDQEAYRAVYSPNWLTVYEGLGLPKEHWQRADELWTQHYDEQRASLIEGAGETVTEIRKKGYRLGVVSSGNSGRVNREIKELGLAGFFEVVVCHEQIKNRKPHPEGIEIALQQLGIAATQTAYVGDSPEDIQMGKSANVTTVGVLSTYPTSWKLQGAEPDIYLESFTDLINHF